MVWVRCSIGDQTAADCDEPMPERVDDASSIGVEFTGPCRAPEAASLRLALGCFHSIFGYVICVIRHHRSLLTSARLEVSVLR